MLSLEVKNKVRTNGEQLIKSKKRVEKYGEVYTPSRIVKEMCNVVDAESAGACARIDSKILEPACGTGNFLVEILDRKLDECQRLYSDKPQEHVKHIFHAMTTLYGIDILGDNVRKCRCRLFLRAMRRICRITKSSKRRYMAHVEVSNILHKNIICGNFLTHKLRLEYGCYPEIEDLSKPIQIVEWYYDDSTKFWDIKCRYTLDELMSNEA